MEPKQLNFILRWLWLLLLFPAISMTVAYWYLQNEPIVYEAQATLIIGPGIDSPNPDLNDLRAGEQLMQTYAELPKTDSFLEMVIDNLDLSLDNTSLEKLISMRPVIGTQLLRVKVEDEDPQNTILITNEIAENLILQGPSSEATDFLFSRIQQQANNIEQDIIKVEGRLEILTAQLTIEDNIVNQNLLIQQIADEERRLADSNSTLADLYEVLQQPLTNRIEIIDYAVEALPIASQTALTLVIAAGAGLVFSALIALALISRENDIMDVSSLNSSSEFPIWGTLKSYSKVDKLVVVDNPDSKLARQYYQIGAQLLYQRDTENIQSILFTSLNHQDDVPEIVMNVASAIARSQNSVFLMDINFRTNQVGKMFNLDNATVLSDLLTDVATEQISIGNAEPYPNLKVLPSGTATTEHSFDMLASPRMLQILQLLRKTSKNYSHLLVTAPPFADMEDSLTLVSQVDSVVIVVKNRTVTFTKVREAIAKMESFGGHVRGILVIQ
jgi:capsular polysaccharide biosynthesis protein/Mrp family chromosome partitioning ATPase